MACLPASHRQSAFRLQLSAFTMTNSTRNLNLTERGLWMAQAVVSSEKVREILLLRLIVATLGERATPPWWKTQFLTDVGMRSMARIFPRTALSAALNSVSIVAREDHDRR